MTDVDEPPFFPMSRTMPLDPPPAYAHLREHEPVSKVRIWNGNEAWLITRYEDQRAVLSDPRFSANSDLPGYPSQSAAFTMVRKKGGRNFLTMDRPEHDVYRRMLNKHFAVKHVATLRPMIQSIVDELVDALVDAGPPADLVQSLALPAPLITICRILGVPTEDLDFFHEQSDIIMSQGAPEEVTDAGQQLFNYFEQLLDRKTEQPGEDVISVLADYLARGEIPRRQAIITCTLLLVAGHESTANTIALGTLLLLNHPDQIPALVSGDARVRAQAVDEVLRFTNVTHAGRRRVALEDVEVAGQVIRAGEGVIVPNDSGNRDPAAFPEPDAFDAERGSRHHLTFGYGIHQCIGQHLARVELEVVFRTLFERLPDLSLAVPQEQLVFKEDMTVYGVRELPVRW